MIEVTVKLIPRVVTNTFYEITMREDDLSDGDDPARLMLTRDEYTSLIMQLTGQLARLDQEAQA